MNSVPLRHLRAGMLYEHSKGHCIILRVLFGWAVFVGCFRKTQTAQHLSPSIIQTIVQLSVPLRVDGSNYNEHFQAEENAALCCAVLLLFLLYSSQLPDCTENHSSTITVAMATRGEIHFTSLFVTLPPSIPSLSLSLSAIIFFISRCYLLLFSFLPVLVRGRTGSRGCSTFLNKQHSYMASSCYNNYISALFLVESCCVICCIDRSMIYCICDTFVLCTSY